MTSISGHESGLDRGGFLKLLGGAGAAGALGLVGVEAAEACAGFDPEREPSTFVGPPEPGNPRRVPIRTRGLETSATPPGTPCGAALVARSDSPIDTIVSLSLVKTGTNTPATGFPALWTPASGVTAATKKVLTGIALPSVGVQVFGFSVSAISPVPAGEIVDFVAVVRLKPGRTQPELRASLATYHAWVVGRFRPGSSLDAPQAPPKYDHQIDYKQPPAE